MTRSGLTQRASRKRLPQRGRRKPKRPSKTQPVAQMVPGLPRKAVEAMHAGRPRGEPVAGAVAEGAEGARQQPQGAVCQTHWPGLSKRPKGCRTCQAPSIRARPDAVVRAPPVHPRTPHQNVPTHVKRQDRWSVARMTTMMLHPCHFWCPIAAPARARAQSRPVQGQRHPGLHQPRQMPCHLPESALPAAKQRHAARTWQHLGPPQSRQPLCQLTLQFLQQVLEMRRSGGDT
mmetsp:Transcript_71524/g.202902  ORF Transcript_71524/g.202902 Transcript_71524/m.202902 type:complete len:232 (+) Transcript_71524:2172-2867(+)